MLFKWWNRKNDNLEKQAISIFQNFIINKNKIQYKKLQDISILKYGKNLPTKNILKTGYPVFGGNGIIGFFNSYSYELPQILVSCRGAASGKIIISYPKSFITNNSLIIEMKDRKYFEFFKIYFQINQLYNYATGSAQPQITIENIKDILVPFPEYEQIDKLTILFSYFSDKIFYGKKENEKLTNLKNYLLPKLMNGEIDVEKIEL